ncbi:MAG: T9SS type A sorting domain-containing protein [Crocinitomicaceae bacterium]|nr:T9SS type A sorting domain-containing protein [Crocinitomicaceae bacterium]
MKTIISTIAFLVFTMHSFAQVTNGDFENWNTLSATTWPAEMIDTHNVQSPMLGLIDNWSVDYETGLTQTTDAYSGTYAAVIHNWYNYAETTITYREAISEYPMSITGAYKYLSTYPDAVAAGNVMVKSVVGDTIINQDFTFGDDEQWSTFAFALTTVQSTMDAADSIIISFRNAETSCQSNLMTCNLLYLDKINVSESAVGLNELAEMDVAVYPNPSTGLVTVQTRNSTVSDAEFQIVDLFGKIVFTQAQNGDQKVEMDLTNLKNGTYMVRVISSQAITQRKIVLSR